MLFILIKLKNLRGISSKKRRASNKRLPSPQLLTRYLLETFSSDIQFFLFYFSFRWCFFILWFIFIIEKYNF